MVTSYIVLDFNEKDYYIEFDSNTDSENKAINLLIKEALNGLSENDKKNWDKQKQKELIKRCRKVNYNYNFSYYNLVKVNGNIRKNKTKNSICFYRMMNLYNNKNNQVEATPVECIGEIFKHNLKDNDLKFAILKGVQNFMLLDVNSGLLLFDCKYKKDIKKKFEKFFKNISIKDYKSETNNRLLHYKLKKVYNINNKTDK